MQISPRYDGPPALVVEADVGRPGEALMRQRRRLLQELQKLDDAGWATQSRCSEWPVQGVITHLTSADQFWALSIASALGGEPTRFLVGFDPVATPAQMVAAHAGKPPAETLNSFDEAVDDLATAVTGIYDWHLLGEAPPGHIPLTGVVLHALWDGWVHERDVLIPLGITPVEEPDEVSGCLSYAAAISPSFGAVAGSGREGTLCIAATDPTIELTVGIGDSVVVRDGLVDGAACLKGRAVDLVEGLTYRAPLDHDLAPEDAWMIAGLGQVFDRAG